MPVATQKCQKLSWYCCPGQACFISVVDTFKACFVGVVVNGEATFTVWITFIAYLQHTDVFLYISLHILITFFVYLFLLGTFEDNIPNQNLPRKNYVLRAFSLVIGVTIYLSLANTDTCAPLQLSMAGCRIHTKICNCTLHIAFTINIPSTIAHHTKHTSTLLGYKLEGGGGA